MVERKGEFESPLLDIASEREKEMVLDYSR